MHANQTAIKGREVSSQVLIATRFHVPNKMGEPACIFFVASLNENMTSPAMELIPLWNWGTKVRSYEVPFEHWSISVLPPSG